MDPTKKELYTAKRSSGVGMNEEEIKEAWSKVKDDNCPTNWVLVSYVGGSTANVGVIGIGEGGLDEMIQALNDSSAFFGAIRCSVNGSIKFFSFFFIGENLGGMARGKASLHKSSILNCFEVHGEISCMDIVNTTRATITEQIRRLSANGVEIEI
jgi:hypothetical protein